MHPILDARLIIVVLARPEPRGQDYILQCASAVERAILIGATLSAGTVAVKQRVTTEGGIVNRSSAGYFFRALTTS